jgi:hypothetical protein
MGGDQDGHPAQEAVLGFRRLDAIRLDVEGADAGTAVLDRYLEQAAPAGPVACGRSERELVLLDERDRNPPVALDAVVQHRDDLPERLVGLGLPIENPVDRLERARVRLDARF